MPVQPRAPSASRSVRCALLTPQASPGSLYRCGREHFLKSRRWATTGGKRLLTSAPKTPQAVRTAISAHFVPPFSGEPPKALAGFQGLNGIPGWETESVLHTTAKQAGALGLEAFTFDAGVCVGCHRFSYQDCRMLSLRM